MTDADYSGAKARLEAEGYTELEGRSATSQEGLDFIRQALTPPVMIEATPGAVLDLPISDDVLAGKLLAAGIDSPEKVAAASDDDLLKIPGIGAATVAKIRAMQKGA
jgi:hypothetical protein